MPQVASESGLLNYRVVGVCVEQAHVLLHTEAQDDFWVLPGGRPLVHETSRDALAREMHEEIETAVEVGRLLWVVENVFSYGGRRLHELAFYYTMSFPADSPYRDVRREFTGREGEITLFFRWFPVDGVENVNLRPAFLRSALASLPTTPVHVVQIDEPHEQSTWSFENESARSPLP